ncbi:iron-containing alcohol dehydrogenase [Candidatus Omnitrophota bacterium]
MKKGLGVRCFSSPRNIYFGKGCLRYLERLKAKKVFIVTDATMISLDIVETVSRHLRKANMNFEVFNKVEAEPSTETVAKGAQAMKSSQPDWIIGLGGGSCIDAAKAMWVFYERPELSWADLLRPGAHLGLRNKAKLILIPTTSGTGADVSWSIIITDKEKREKLEIASTEAIADLVILDPELAKKMPPQLTANTGLDVLTHAIEAYVATLKNDFSDGLAIHAANLVFKWLPKACKNGNDAGAREHMHNAATIAGLSFGNSQAGLAHSLGHSLGVLFKIPHGKCVGIFLPYVIEYNARMKKVSRLYAEITEALHLGDTVKNLVDNIHSLIKEIGNPLAIKDLVEEKDLKQNLDALVDRAKRDACTATNPVSPSDEDLKNIFKYSYEGKTIDF